MAALLAREWADLTDVALPREAKQAQPPQPRGRQYQHVARSVGHRGDSAGGPQPGALHSNDQAQQGAMQSQRKADGKGDKGACCDSEQLPVFFVPGLKLTMPIHVRPSDARLCSCAI